LNTIKIRKNGIKSEESMKKPKAYITEN